MHEVDNPAPESLEESAVNYTDGAAEAHTGRATGGFSSPYRTCKWDRVPNRIGLRHSSSGITTFHNSIFHDMQVMTLEGWPDVARAATNVEPWVWPFGAHRVGSVCGILRDLSRVYMCQLDGPPPMVSPTLVPQHVPQLRV